MDEGRINWDEGNNVRSIAFIGSCSESFIVCRVVKRNAGVFDTVFSTMKSQSSIISGMKFVRLRQCVEIGKLVVSFCSHTPRGSELLLSPNPCARSRASLPVE